jgi:hypothetical protein
MAAIRGCLGTDKLAHGSVNALAGISDSVGWLEGFEAKLDSLSDIRIGLLECETLRMATRQLGCICIIAVFILFDDD